MIPLFFVVVLVVVVRFVTLLLIMMMLVKLQVRLQWLGLGSLGVWLRFVVCWTIGLNMRPYVVCGHTNAPQQNLVGKNCYS